MSKLQSEGSLGRIEMDPKVLVDAVMHIVLDAALVDDSVVENAAKACATWEELRGDTVVVGEGA